MIRTNYFFNLKKETDFFKIVTYDFIVLEYFPNFNSIYKINTAVPFKLSQIQ